MNIRADMKPVSSDRIIAFGDVYLDEKVVIHNVRVVQAEKDGKIYHFLSFPQKKVNQDKWDSFIYIKDKDLRKQIEDVVNQNVMDRMKLEKEPVDMTVDVRIFNKDETRAYATINYAGLVKIDGVRICEKEGELKVIYPYEKVGEQYQNIAGPVSPGTRKRMNEAVIKAYEDKRLEVDRNRDKAPGPEPDPALADVTLPWDKKSL